MEFSFDFFFWTQICFDDIFDREQRSGPRNKKIVLVSLLFFRCYVSLFFRFWGAISFDRIFNAIGIFRSPSVMFLLESLWPNRTTFPLFFKSIFQLVFHIGSAHRFALVSTGCRREMKELCACCLKIWTRPPRLGRSSRSFRSCLRYFG
jgi:hypothetical protein